MDDYPKHLAPEFEDSGAVSTPFDEWWERVKGEFPNVPEEVAHYWLHEHWGNSPYAFLKSAEHTFERVSWPIKKLFEVLTNWNDYAVEKTECLARGYRLVDGWRFDKPYRTTPYMLEKGAFPTPIIVLDNRDGHISEEGLPVGYVLVEGHRRFDIALHLFNTSRFKPEAEVWLMKKK